jgi:GMP synthase (glutamine-hydrolysing)
VEAAVNLVFLRHVAHEGGGRFERVAQAAGWNTLTISADAPGAEALARAADVLVILGGPMGVYEAGRYPYLNMEIEVLRDRLERRAPSVGICLGAQLLAAAAGARVYKGAAGFEVGFGEVVRAAGAEANPLGRPLPERFPVMHWHGDTFDLPQGAALLASSARYANQIFALGAHALGLQCHIEVSHDELPVFAGGNASDLERAGRPGLAQIIAAGQRHDLAVERVFAGLWRAFCAENHLAP